MTLRSKQGDPKLLLTRRETHKSLLGAGLVSLIGCETREQNTRADAGNDSDTSEAGTRCIDEPVLETAVFAHGVASGDPLSDRVILWTRISTFHSPQNVTWEMSLQASFQELIAQGTVISDASRDYVVKIDASGLTPATTYFYRFRIGNDVSPIGRTRTAPTDNRRLRFAVVTCSNYNHGYFHLYRSIAEIADLDAVLHLGDYIYEYANSGCGQSYAMGPAGGNVRNADPSHEIVSLSDYRRRYAHYRKDRDLQEVHRQHPFIATWDDHEIANNANRVGAANHSASEGSYADRKAAATQAYFEWLPIREREAPRLYRSFVYGDMAELIVLDTRVEGRDPQPVQANDPQPASCACPDLNSPDRRMISAEQEAFLVERLASSRARYRVLCQQVIFAQLQPIFPSIDTWDGYPVARQRVLQALANANTSLILTGDMHAAFAMDVPDAPFDPAQYHPDTHVGSRAVEFVVPALTSYGLEDYGAEQYYTPRIRDGAPHVRLVDFSRRGYGLLDLDEAGAELTFVFNENVTSPTRNPDVVGETWGVAQGERSLTRVTTPRAVRTDAPALAP